MLLSQYGVVTSSSGDGEARQAGDHRQEKRRCLCLDLQLLVLASGNNLLKFKSKNKLKRLKKRKEDFFLSLLCSKHHKTPAGG